MLEAIRLKCQGSKERIQATGGRGALLHRLSASSMAAQRTSAVALSDDATQGLVLGLPRPALVIFVVEFAERLGYYAVAFSLFTYGRHLLGISATGMQAVMNSIYLVVPLAACLSSGLADGTWGRSRTLMVFLVAYATGLALLTVSSFPFMFREFPLGARVGSFVCFAVALCFFAVGYGGMKVCTNPMMADSVTAVYRAIFAKANACEAYRHDDGHAVDADSVTGKKHCGEYGTWSGASGQLATHQAGGAQQQSDREVAPSCAQGPDLYCSDSQERPAAALAFEVVQETVLESQRRELERVLARAFHLVYWVSNVGSLFGILVAPLMRDWDSRSILFGSDTYTTGYYYGFAMATVSVVAGLVFFHGCRRHFPRQEPSPPFLFFRLVGRAVLTRVRVALSGLSDPVLQAEVERHGFLAYGLYSPSDLLRSDDSTPRVVVVSADDPFTVADRAQPVLEEAGGVATTPEEPVRRGAVSDSPGIGDMKEHDDRDAVWLANARATLRVCKAFVALPIYWLICNQYSTTLMFSVEALDLPSSIPPDLFNNINTFTLLLFIALSERVLYPRFAERHGGRGPSPRLRIVCGFLLVVVSMLWCGLVQVAIDGRGVYVDAEGKYTINDGATKLSAAWLVLPYILQGVAAALVDPASMEVAYTGAPESMKGTVMALYWMASSASGFLGLVLSPVMRPQYGVALYMCFAAALLLVTALFYRLNSTGAYTNVALDSVQAQVVHGTEGAWTPPRPQLALPSTEPSLKERELSVEATASNAAKRV